MSAVCVGFFSWILSLNFSHISVSNTILLLLTAVAPLSFPSHSSFLFPAVWFLLWFPSALMRYLFQMDSHRRLFVFDWIPGFTIEFCEEFKSAQSMWILDCVAFYRVSNCFEGFKRVISLHFMELKQIQTLIIQNIRCQNPSSLSNLMRKYTIIPRNVNGNE